MVLSLSSHLAGMSRHTQWTLLDNLFTPVVASYLCGKSYWCPVLGTRFGSTGTWYSPGPSAGEHHLPLVLVYHHDR